MKKNSTCPQSPRRDTKTRRQEMTIGMDLGDKTLHRLWVTAEVYEPLRNSQAKPRTGKAAA
jgi:hypothetical protein